MKPFGAVRPVVSCRFFCGKTAKEARGTWVTGKAKNRGGKYEE